MSKPTPRYTAQLTDAEYVTLLDDLILKVVDEGCVVIELGTPSSKVLIRAREVLRDNLKSPKS